MILLYHKVFLESPTEWWVNANQFWRQMNELRDRTVVYLDDYDPNDEKQVVITFDGVYENVYRYALPILKSFNYPFELFVVGDTIGKENIFDQKVEPPARFADSEQLGELVRNGGRLQWHSLSHIDLTKESDPSTLEKELQVPEEIRRLDGKGFNWFGYPYGNHDEDLISITKEQFAGALSCVNGNDYDRYQYNRIIVTNQTSFSHSTTSLIIANYNYAAYLAEAVESVLRQTVQPDEILFIDDCSTDDSIEIAKRYEDHLRIVQNEKNLGIIENFKKAVSLTSGDYICFLGADNRFRSDYIEKCKHALDTNPGAAIAYTYCTLFGPRAEVIARKIKADPVPDFPSMFFWRFPEYDRAMLGRLKTVNIMHGSSMYRREAYDQVGGYQQSEGHEDHNLFYGMLSKGWDAVLVPEFVLEYRQHSEEQSNVRVGTEMELAYTRKALKLQKEQYRILQEKLDLQAHRVPDLDEKINRIRMLMNQERSNEARRAAEQLLGSFPEQAEVIRTYAQTLVLDGNLTGAEAALEVALSYDPQMAQAYNDLGSICYRQGKEEDALVHLQKAADLSPDNVIILKNLADLYARQERIVDSLLAYQKVIELEPQDIEALLALGVLCQQQDRAEDARFFFQRVLELEPGNLVAAQSLKTISPR
ncbi:MAG: glycosyltransferase [Fidelibacterota bacterium]|nr:MAG: glycosyltransferase [Candidatus Neomarinimicrobiota bacterium]